jgi:hypothetical protein
MVRTVSGQFLRPAGPFFNPVISEQVCNMHAGQIVATLPPSQAPGKSPNPARAAVDIVLKGQYWLAVELKHGSEKDPH